MITNPRKNIYLVLLLLAALFTAVSPPATQGTGDVIFGVDTNNNLVSFSSLSPGTLLGSFPITGIGSDQIVGIDFRPATSALYALGVSGGTGRIYVVDTFSGAAAQVGSGGFALAGGSFAWDFNPTVDRIRLVSDAEENLRLNPITGGLAATDSNINPAGNIVAAAYSNNASNARSTTLYVIDADSDTLALQGGVNGSPSPNAGGVTTIGALGVNTSSQAGLDISSGGAVYASLTSGGSSSLYTVNLGSGAATLLGGIGGAPLRDIALATGRGGGQSAPLCADFNGVTSPSVRASIGDVASGNAVLCRVLVENGSFRDGAGAAIGNGDVLAQRILQAVDIYTSPGNVSFTGAIQVCLLGVGNFIFLDAAGTPRTPALLSSSTQGAYTCAFIPNAGTVLLTASS